MSRKTGPPLSISVVTPSFNQASFIERTIKSVLDQDVPGLEYLIVDGGSTDGTLGILRQYEDRLEWISEPDGGQAEAVNKGIRATGGEIIGWLNSDDIYYSGALAYVTSWFASNPGVDILYGDANHIGLEDEIIEAYPVEDWDYERLMFTCFLCQPAVFFRRSVVERYGYLDTRWRYSLDYEYWLRLGQHLVFQRIPYLLAGSRIHLQAKTFGEPVRAHREYMRMFRDRFGYVPDRWVFNYAHAKVNQMELDRQTPLGQARYISGLLAVSVGAFLRWNHTIPSSARRTMREWIRSPLAGALRGIVKR